MQMVILGKALTLECNHKPFLLMSDPSSQIPFVYSIDTGVDYSHPSLGGCFGPGFKVAGGFDFVGDAFNGKHIP